MHNQYPQDFAESTVAEQQRKEADNAVLLQLISELKLADSYGRIVTDELVVKARRLA